MSFGSGWKNSNENSFSKNFTLDLQPNKIYLLQMPDSKIISELRVNNSIVSGNKQNGNYVFNITEYLNTENDIVVRTNEKRDKFFDIKLHCINKIFVPEVALKLYKIENAANSLSVEVKVKNAFNTEKQGYLKYQLYSDKNKIIAERETPVFIAGNAENTYLQQIDISHLKGEKNISVECKLYFDNKLMDKYYRECFAASCRN